MTFLLFTILHGRELTEQFKSRQNFLERGSACLRISSVKSQGNGYREQEFSCILCILDVRVVNQSYRFLSSKSRFKELKEKSAIDFTWSQLNSRDLT